MGLSNLEMITALSVFCYIASANWKQYTMAQDWLESHHGADVLFYEDWIQKSKHFSILNYINFHTGYVGRKIAYKLRSKKRGGE